MKECDLQLFRRNLVKIRSFRGLIAKDLSEKCGLRQLKRIADIEDGRGKPTLEELISICAFLGVKLDDMLYNIPTITFV